MDAEFPPLERGGRSLHRRILADIEARILSGEWAPGHRIPFEHELTAHYGCSRMTVSKALSRLASAGLIERRRKAGSFVTRPVGQSAVLEIQDAGAEVAALGLTYEFAVLARETRRATAADRARLAVKAGEAVLALTCRHLAAGRPYCHEDRLISLSAVPEAEHERFAAAAPGSWLMARAPWSAAEHRIGAAGADEPVADVLRLKIGAPCLVVERRTWMGERPVTQVRLTYPAGRRELVARFTPSQA